MKKERKKEKKANINMDYSASYLFEINEVSYRAEITGTIFPKNMVRSGEYQLKANLPKYLQTILISELTSKICDDDDDVLFNFFQSKKIFSNENGSMALFLDDDIYAFTFETKTIVESKFINLIKPF